jgi:hypothetical protein
MRLLEASETAFHNALTVYTKEQLPLNWINTSSNLTETLFLSSQFAKTRDHLEILLDYPDWDPDDRVGLLAIAIANSVALRTVEQTEARLEKALSVLSRQDFRFLCDVGLPLYQGLYRQGSGVRQSPSMVAALQTARDAFRKVTNP